MLLLLLSCNSEYEGDDTKTADWWISEMEAEYAGAAASHSEDELVPKYYLTLTHSLQLDFVEQ